MARVVPKTVVDAAAVDARFSRWNREKQNRVASRGPRSGERKGDGWKRTDRDTRLLEFVTLHGMILYRQAAEHFYGGKSTASARVTKMVQAGLLNRDDGVAEWAGMVLTPTRAGQSVVLRGDLAAFDSLALRALSPPENMLHSALVADRLLMAMAQGYTVLTERQIRVLDRADPAAVEEFLTSKAVGCKFSADGVAPGIAPGRVWRPGPKVPGGSERQVIESEAFVSAAYPRENQQLNDPRPGSVRYPDFIQVTPSGELIAVEVEISTKASDRIEALVAGYANAVARLIPDGQGGYRSQMVQVRNKTTGELQQVQRPMLARRQFRQVRWLCAPESMSLLRGRRRRFGGPYTGGFIPQLMPDEYTGVNWANQNPELPMLVAEVTADDIGVQYALDQRILPASYHCSFKRWRLWREVWEDEVPADMRGVMTFARWLMVPSSRSEVSNLEMCFRAEDIAANAAPSRGRYVR